MKKQVGPGRNVETARDGLSRGRSTSPATKDPLHIHAPPWIKLWRLARFPIPADTQRANVSELEVVQALVLRCCHILALACRAASSLCHGTKREHCRRAGE